MDTEDGRVTAHQRGADPTYGEGPRALTSSATATLVKATWERVSEGGKVVDLFYQRLFELDPETRDLFAATDMEHLHTKFGDTVRMLLASLDEASGLRSLARRSGERHAVYGVRDRDYRTGGEALLWALAQELGNDFTAEVRAAWAEAYTRLAFVMERSRR
jgi:hemoglobin-like flavoprotein